MLHLYRPILHPHKNQSINLQGKSIAWFLYDCSIGLYGLFGLTKLFYLLGEKSLNFIIERFTKTIRASNTSVLLL